MPYANPSLTEIFVELRTEPGGLGLQESSQIATKLQTRLGAPMEWTQAVGPGLIEPRIRCWSTERRELVQLGPDLFVVNRLGPYLGWDSFMELFGWALGVVTEVSPAFTPATVALSTVDGIDAPRDGFTMGRYLACGGRFVPGWYADVRDASDINLGRGTIDENAYNRQASIAVRMAPERALVQLNVMLQERIGGTSDLLGVLARLHDESNQMFEDIISDGTRALMGGKV